MNFFSKPNPAEQLRAQNRELRKAQRDVDRAKRDLEKQEKQLENDIKKAAKDGNKILCTKLASQLVKLRKQKDRCVTANSQIGAISTQTKVMEANQKMATAVASTAGTMKKINDSTKTAEMMKTLQEFSKQNQMMEMKEELIDETLSAALDASGDEEEQDDIVNQVLDEIGIEISGKLANAPMVKGQLAKDSKKSGISDSEIEAQLAKLKM